MDKQELEKSLLTLGVNPRNYMLNGPPYNDSSWVVEPVYGKKGWSVFNFERGKRYDEKPFDNEDEACKYIYERLKKHQEIVIKFKLNE